MMNTSKHTVKMKLSNKMLVGAGVVLCILVISIVIAARVTFDNEILPSITNNQHAPSYTTTYIP